jgi:hypothetical protein
VTRKFLLLAMVRADGQGEGMNSTDAKKAPQQMVKILGYTVRAGSKRHALLVWQQKHFNDLAKGEGR